MVDLLECPFCGGPSRFVGREGQGYNVECEHCLARGGWGDYGYQAEESWNRRAAPKPTLSGCAAIYAPVTLNSLGRGPADKGDTDRIEHQVWDPETCETLCVAKDEETARWIVAALSSPLPGEE